MSSFRTYVPVAEVRGMVLRRWRTRERRGWNAVECEITRLLLKDGRLVEQEWPLQQEKPSGHYVVLSGARVGEEVEMMSRSPHWAEQDPSDYEIIGGVRR